MKIEGVIFEGSAMACRRGSCCWFGTKGDKGCFVSSCNGTSPGKKAIQVASVAGNNGIQ